MNHLKTHSKVALGYFLIAALLGLILRSFYVFEIPITFKFFVHTHSHIALLGWVYIALTTVIYKIYLEKLQLQKKYTYLFGFTQLTLIGMLGTFPFQGYALFSIVFSTLFLIATYWFFWFFKKHTATEIKTKNSYKCISVALWFMVLSSIGPWMLGGIMSTLGATSVWYRMAIYFYLHFQYNGWMMMALLGILVYILETQQLIIPKTVFRRIFYSINLGIVATFSLSTLFTEPPFFLYLIGGIGAMLQLYGLTQLLKFLINHRKNTQAIFNKFQLLVLKTIGVLALLKMILQLLTVLPYFANLAVTILDFTIGYLHWTFLGVVTISLFLFLDYLKLFKLSTKGYYLYLLGFMLTEGLIFYKGFIIWQNLPLIDGYFKLLLLGSLSIVVSLLYLFFTAITTDD